jgi:predicted transcriptional regulator of viral defense system
MNWIEIEKKLTEKSMNLFSATEFRRATNQQKTAAQKQLERYTKRGILARLKNGVYMIRSKPAAAYSISNKLYGPSYISFESALSFYGIIPETVYGITAATTKPTRNFTVDGRELIYHKIKKSAYSDYRPEKIGNETTLIASPEKALTDYLYLVSLGKKPMNERLSLRKLDKSRILENAKHYGRPAFIRWIKDDILRND